METELYCAVQIGFTCIILWPPTFVGWESLHMLSLEVVHRNKQQKLLEESKVM